MYDEESYKHNNLIKKLSNSSHIKQPIFVFDQNKNYIKKYDSINQAEKLLGIRHEKIKHSVLTGISVNNYFFSNHRLLNLSNKK